MTACKEVLGGGASKTKKVLGTTLAGALAVGMVPAAGIAATADTAVADDGDTFAPMVVENAFDTGLVTKATIDGTAKTSTSGGPYSVTHTGSSIEFVPTEVKLLATTNGTSTKITIADADLADKKSYKVEYYKADSNGKATGDALAVAPQEIGSYIVRLSAIGGDYKGGKIDTLLNITAAAFTSLNCYPVKTDGTLDTGKSLKGGTNQLTYNGAAIKVGFTVTPTGGSRTTLKEGSDYTVKWYKKGADQTDDQAMSGVPTEAGAYAAVITGMGTYQGSEGRVDNITINPFNLADINSFDVITTTSSTAPKHPTAVVVSGVRYTEPAFLEQIDLEFDRCTSQSTVTTFSVDGKYEYSASADSDNKNFTGTTSIKDTICKVKNLATIKYDGKAMEGSITLKAGDFAESKIKLYDAQGKELKDWRKNTDYTITYAKAGGTSATSTSLANAGKYTVKVNTKPGSTHNSDYALGGEATMEVNVIDGTIDADANVYVAYDGVATSKVEATYTGADIKSKIAVTVYDEDGSVLTKGANADYEVTYKNADGTPVTAIKDAGSYTLEITSDKYELKGATTVPITVSKFDLSDLRVCERAYSGSTITTNGTVKSPAGYVYIALPKSGDGASETLADYKLEYFDGKEYKAVPSSNPSVGSHTLTSWEKLGEDGEWKAATKITGEGTYRVTVAPKTADGEKNYKFETAEGTTLTYEVADSAKFVFDDVTPDQWYFDCIADAADYSESNPVQKRAYMNGIGGTKLFQPNKQITRAEVACVLFNMAGGQFDATVDNGYSETDGWNTGFSDVNGKMYYSQALAWAHAAGVINGYGDGTFAPDSLITREEFAAMLSNYALQRGGAVAPEDVDAVLAAMPDGDQVSGWARTAVAWAVDNEIMGNGGVINPNAQITRAETAAMAVNYQPRA